VDSTACSTDRVAYDRTEVRLVLDGAPRYVRTGSGSTWIPIGTPEVSLADLSALLDLGLTHDIDGITGTSLGARLGPPSDTAAAGTVELTVHPGVQRDTARALTKEVDGIPPLPGGAVVIEARTGHVLAAATTTGDPKADAPTGPVDPNVLRSWTRSHPFAVRDNNGDVDESKPCSESDVDNCWRVSLVPAKPPVNRALSLWYGLGSTFKVVVATAFLRLPGNTADTLIPAPLTIAAGDHEIKNANGGACPKSVQGMISLADALAVSCNTAFVKLAMNLEWPAIRQAAVDYGFVVGPTANVRRQPAWVAGTRLGIDSRVPNDAGGDIGNDALGGGGVVGTPLEMATVMAAVANGGTVHKPIIVEAVTPARGGNRVVTQGESRAVLTPEQAAQLRLALAGTTEPFGTAKSLHAPDGRPLWVKTGTHVKNTGAVAPAGSTPPPEIAWMIGFLETPPGPVAFAVAVETTDEAQGAARARWLAEQIIASIVKARP
jgi:cell division protein FtsI/penicillin-binding protein 2